MRGDGRIGRRGRGMELCPRASWRRRPSARSRGGVDRACRTCSLWGWQLRKQMASHSAAMPGFVPAIVDGGSAEEPAHTILRPKCRRRSKGSVAAAASHEDALRQDSSARDRPDAVSSIARMTLQPFHWSGHGRAMAANTCRDCGRTISWSRTRY